MKNILTILLIVLSLTGFSQQPEQQITWHTDIQKATTLAIESNKPVLMFFTGSDWCGWCIRLQKAVFLKPEFKEWANKNVILVELDFPKRTPIAPEILKQNKELAGIFGVRGYPTIWFVNPEITGGKINFNKLGSQGASPLDTKGWIAGADRIIQSK